MEKKIEVRDSRRRQMYRVDDDYLNGYARLCGVYATAVYNSLCRHADSNQESFPSIERIMEQHALSKPTVIRAIKKLEEWGIIAVSRERDKKTKRQMVNVYVLVDKSQWKPKPGKPDLPSPSKQDLPGAGSISDAEPGKSHDEKPGKPDLPEGYTEEKEAQRRIVATSATDSQENKKDRPMNLDQFVRWCSKSSQKHVRIIGEWAETTEPAFESVGQWEAYIKRNLRAAKTLTPFTHDQLSDGFVGIKKAIREGWLTTFTLETLYKFVTSEKIKTT